MHPEVRRHLTARQIAAALDYKNSLGLAGYFVDRVLAVYEKQKKEIQKSTPRAENPWCSRQWCKWPRSLEYRLLPVSRRRTTAAVVSRIGIVSAASGAASATVAGPFSEVRMASTPTTNPISMLPQSPRKMLAGGKL